MCLVSIQFALFAYLLAMKDYSVLTGRAAKANELADSTSSATTVGLARYMHHKRRFSSGTYLALCMQ